MNRKLMSIVTFAIIAMNFIPKTYAGTGEGAAVGGVLGLGAGYLIGSKKESDPVAKEEAREMKEDRMRRRRQELREEREYREERRRKEKIDYEKDKTQRDAELKKESDDLEKY